MRRNNDGVLITILIGIIFGIIVGYNAFLTLIPGIVSVLWAALAIGIVTLIILLLIAVLARERKERCINKNAIYIALSAVGTIITAIIGLAITITAESIGIAILIALGTLFLIVTILNLLRLIICLTSEACECR